MRGFVLVIATFVCLATAGAAQAATSFTMQFAPESLPEGTALSLNGDQVTSFSATLRPTGCTSPNWQSSSDSVFDVTIPGGADVQLSGGSFSYSGEAQSAYYGSGSGGETYGGKFSVTGTINPDHTVMTGKVILSNAQDPFVSGCSGTYNLVAIPTVTPRSTRPDRRAYQSQFIHFDESGGVVKNLEFQANFQCGNSVDSATVNASQYGYPTLQTTASGAFHMTSHVLDEYGEILSVSINGTIRGKHARGRVSVSEPPGGFTFITRDKCSGNYAWRAAKAAAPPKPGPSAFFQWDAIRVSAGAGYRYYFAVDGLKCTHRANALRVTAKHKTITISCSKRAAFASHSLAPGRTYTVKSQALERRHGRVVKRGAAVKIPLHMPGPGDHWTPISGLPGTPPS